MNGMELMIGIVSSTSLTSLDQPPKHGIWPLLTLISDSISACAT